MFKKILLYIGGVLIMLAGVAGLILPVLPGWVLIFLGLSLIAPRLAERLKRRVFVKFFKSDVVYLEEWKATGVQAGFTTKNFHLFLQNAEGLSEEGTQAKFLSLLSESHVVRSHRLGPFKKFAVLNQVHGDKVAVLPADGSAQTYEKDGFYPLAGYDAVVTDIQGLTLLAFSADCLTLFFSAGHWVGLAHAGWRGSRDKIAQKTVRLLTEKSGCPARHIRVVLGPSIGVKHYPVGPEFRHIFPESSLLLGKGRDRSLHFDLARENKRQLRKTGVTNKNMTDLEICTVAENGDFYSFRKEKDKAGRIISFIVKPA